MDYLEQFSNDSKQIVGSRIRQCRTSMRPKMNANQLSAAVAALNVKDAPSERTITKYETGLTACPLPVLAAFARIFNCDPAWISGMVKNLVPDSLTKVPYYEANGNNSLNNLSFKKSWLDSKGVKEETLVLVVSEIEGVRKTYLINKERTELSSDGYYGLIINGECIVRYIRVRVSGEIAVYVDVSHNVAIDEFSVGYANDIASKISVLGRAFQVTSDV